MTVSASGRGGACRFPSGRWLGLFLLCSALLLGTACAESLSGRVVKVADGDTITILSGGSTYKVRLAGIDAPEKGQPYGKASRERLASVVAGRDVVVSAHKTDRYGRKVGVVRVDDIDANLVQITYGMAWHYKAYVAEQSTVDRSRYAAAEESARAQRIGLWADPKPIPPWDWRSAGR